MNLLHIKLVLPLLLLVSAASAQKLKKDDRLVLANLKKHISYLADDKLEGRRAGSPGEKLAMEYISSEFKAIGILPKGSTGFYQPFEINEGKQIGENTQFSINGAALKPGRDFFPFVFSAEKKLRPRPLLRCRSRTCPGLLT